MRVLICCLTCGILAAQNQPPKTGDLCSLEGRVLNEATGDPLEDAILTLRPAQPVQPAAASQAVFTTMSDDSGKFAFAGVEQGRYTLGANRMGFVAENYGAKRPGIPGTPLALAPAQNMTGLEFKLKPQGVIAGRVLDADGDPVHLAGVRLMRARYVNGRKQLSPIGAREVANASGNREMTNDQGQFRFFGLAPGSYFVSADRGIPEIEIVSQDRSPKPAQEAYVETFHPSTADARRAEPVQVLAGKVASGADVTLARVPLGRIRGRVVNLEDLPTGGTPAVSIYRADGAFIGGAGLGKQGEFDIDGRAPQGRAWLVARFLSRNAHVYFSRQPLSLSGGPMDGVEISLSAGIPLRGNVVLEDGGAVGVDLRSIRISLALADLELGGPMPGASAGNDGSFTVNDIGPDRYLLTVAGMPDGVYVKSICMGEEDVLETGLNLTGGAAGPVEIVLSANGGAVEGSVRDERDEAASGVTVALVPQSAKRRERPDWYRTATTDQQGKFVMTGLAPGEYKLFAWDDVEDGAWMDPEFLKPFESHGKVVTVREGGSEAVDLSVIGAQ